VVTAGGISLPASGIQLFTANGINSGNGGSIVLKTFLAGSNITLGTASAGLQMTATGGVDHGGNGGAITISSGGSLTIPVGAIINFSPQAGDNLPGYTSNGGNVTLTASTASTTGALVVNTALNASGLWNGQGGIILLTAGGAASDITVNAPLTAKSGTTSGSAGAVSVSAGRNLTLTSNSLIDVSPLSSISNGGNVTLTASTASTTGNLTDNAVINTGGVDFTNNSTIHAGTVSLTDNSQGTITVNADINATGVVNGWPVQGGTIAISNTGAVGGNGGVVIGSGVTLNAAGAGAFANGGTISINVGTTGLLTFQGGATLNVNGGRGQSYYQQNGGSIVVTAGGISLPASGIQLFTANGINSGNGGSIVLKTFLAGSNITLGTASAGLQMTATGGVDHGGNGGAITISSGGSLTIPVGAIINFSPQAGDNLPGYTSNGGNVTLTASTASTTGALVVNTALNASGLWNGQGGIILLTAGGAASDITVNAPLTAKSGTTSGSAGAVSVSAGRNLTLTSNSLIDVSPLSSISNGGNVTLTASTASTTGNLTDNAVINTGGVDSANNSTIHAGTVSLTDNSQGTITINANINATGVVNGWTVNGGTIAISNTGAAGGNGGVVIGSGVTMNATGAGFANGGTISINVGTTGLLTFQGGATLNVNGGSGQSYYQENGGSIVVTSGDVSVPASGIQLFTANGMNSGNGGSIVLKTFLAGSNITLGTASAGLQFNATGGVDHGGNGGAITISSGGNLTVPVGAIINVNPQAADNLPGYTSNGGQIILTAGTASTNAALTVNATLNVSGIINGAGGVIQLTNNSAGAITVNTNLTANSGSNGSGGVITVTDANGTVTLQNLTANGAGTGNSGGTITISAGNGISSADVNANGSNGASAGNVTITSPGHSITTGYISTIANGGGNGGNINVSGDTVSLINVDPSGNSLNASATGGGNGGNITITTTNLTLPFIICVPIPNGTAGEVMSNGVNGGFIILNNYGGTIISTGCLIEANGTTGNGGKVLFQSRVPAGSAPLTVTINGSVIATNNAGNSGRIGFNGGPGQNITLIGPGSLFAGDLVRIGNLNPITLDLISPPAGTVTIDPRLNIQVGILNNALILTSGFTGPVSIPTGHHHGGTPTISLTPTTTPASPSLQTATSTGTTGQSNPGAAFSRFLALADELAALGASGSTSRLPSGLPSLTATDQTQIFHYANFDQMPEEPNKTEYQLAEGDIEGTVALGGTFTQTEVDNLANAGIVAQANAAASNYLNLDKGNILFSPSHNIVVGTHEGDVYIASGATVFVMETGHDVAIYDFDQSKPGQVSVICGKKKLNLWPGRMIVLTKQDVTDFEEVEGPFKRVGYRRASEMDVDESTKAFSANFSPASALDRIIPLRDMMTSKDRQEQKTMNKILLSAAILIDLEKEGGAFMNEETSKSAIAAAPFKNGDMMR